MIKRLLNVAVNRCADVSFGFHWLMAYISRSGLGSMRISFTGVKWIGGETLQYKKWLTSSFSCVQNLRNVQPQSTHTLKADIIVVTSTTMCIFHPPIWCFVTVYHGFSCARGRKCPHSEQTHPNTGAALWKLLVILAVV